MPLTIKQKIEPRVSDATFDRMRFFTGSLGDVAGLTLTIVVDGSPYKIAFDEHGKGTIIEAPAVSDPYRLTFDP